MSHTWCQLHWTTRELPTPLEFPNLHVSRTWYQRWPSYSTHTLVCFLPLSDQSQTVHTVNHIREVRTGDRRSAGWTSSIGSLHRMLCRTQGSELTHDTMYVIPFPGSSPYLPQGCVNLFGSVTGPITCAISIARSMCLINMRMHTQHAFQFRSRYIYYCWIVFSTSSALAWPQSITTHHYLLLISIPGDYRTCVKRAQSPSTRILLNINGHDKSPCMQGTMEGYDF